MIHALAYTPFADPLVGGWNYWYLTLLPLALGVALVYKSMRVETLEQVPRQTLRAFLKFIIAFILLAAALWAVMLLMERKF